MSDLETLRARVRVLLHEAWDAAGDKDHDPSGYFARRRRELDKLAGRLAQEMDAKIRVRWDGAAVKIAGIRATSTSDLGSALLNWLTAVDKRLQAAGGASTPSPSPSAPPLPLPGGEEGGIADPINLQGSGPAPIVPREG